MLFPINKIQNIERTVKSIIFKLIFIPECIWGKLQQIVQTKIEQTSMDILLEKLLTHRRDFLYKQVNVTQHLLKFWEKERNTATTYYKQQLLSWYRGYEIFYTLPSFPRDEGV